MTDAPLVRTATRSDEAELMNLCRLLHQENGLFSMDEDRVREILRRGFDKQGGIVGVIGAPTKIEATICVILSQMWYSGDWILEELFSYVHPAYRKTANAKHLLNYAKRCSDEIGLPLLIGIISNTRTEAKVELYKRKLSKPRGAFFVYGDRSPNGSANHVQNEKGGTKPFIDAA